MIDFSKLVPNSKFKLRDVKRDNHSKISEWGESHSWPPHYIAKFPKGWSKEDIEIYKQIRQKYISKKIR